MAVKSFKKIQIKDKETSRLQENVELAFKPVLDSQIVNGVLLRDVTLEPSKRNEVQHKLGRKPLGYIVVRKRSDARIWDLQDTNPSPLQTFTLACSHVVQVDLWIF